MAAAAPQLYFFIAKYLTARATVSFGVVYTIINSL